MRIRSPATGHLDVSAAGRRSRWTFLTLVNGFAVALTVGVIAADPDDFAWGVFAALAVLVLVIDWMALRGRTWIECTTLYERRIGTRHADVARAVAVRLCCDNCCGTRLIVTDDRGDSASAELLSLPPGSIRGASPAALEQLAKALALALAPESAAVSLLLHRQARWVLAGGPLRRSPLMPFAVGQYGRLVEAAGLTELIADIQTGETSPGSPE